MLLKIDQFSFPLTNLIVPWISRLVQLIDNYGPINGSKFYIVLSNVRIDE